MLTEKQRDFLVSIIEKVCVYLATVAFVGRLLDKSFDRKEQIGLVACLAILVGIGLILRRK